MIKEDARREIRRRWREIVPHYLDKAKDKQNGETSYICPRCGHGTHGDGITFIPGKDSLKCFGCQWVFDSLELIQEMEGADFPTALQIGADMIGITIDDRQASARQDFQRPADPSPSPAPPPEPTEEEKREIEKIRNKVAAGIRQYAERLPGSPGEKYMKDRGFTDETLQAFRIGYDPAKNAVVIPYPGQVYYIERIIGAEGNGKYQKPPKLTEPLFIAGDPAEGLLICEGQLDALSLIQAGAGAVAAIGGGGDRKLRELQGSLSRAAIIQDNDEPGKKTAERIRGTLEEMKLDRIRIEQPPDGYKDSNDLLKADPEGLRGLVSEWQDKLQQAPIFTDYDKEDARTMPTSAAQFVRSGGWKVNSNIFAKYAGRKTGFKNLDEIETFYPGVYLLNAGTSMGKTSFCVQMADQLAKNGETVLYYAFEQAPFDLIAKSVTRELVLDDLKKGLRGAEPFDDRLYTAIKIKQGRRRLADVYTEDQLQELGLDGAEGLADYGLRLYQQYADRVHYVNCAFGWTIDDVIKSIIDFIEETRTAPTVFIDYLQVIKPADARISDIKAIDYAVQAIRKLAMVSQEKGYPVTFVVISSVSRAQYTQETDISAGKGSGGLEFTADAVWGLQPQIMLTARYRKAKEQTKRRMIKQAKYPGRNKPREVVLEATKNRYGRPDYSIGFNYYPANETFMPNFQFSAWLEEQQRKEAAAVKRAEALAEAKEKQELEKLQAIDKDGYLDIVQTAFNGAKKAIDERL